MTTVAYIAPSGTSSMLRVDPRGKCVCVSLSCEMTPAAVASRDTRRQTELSFSRSNPPRRSVRITSAMSTRDVHRFNSGRFRSFMKFGLSRGKILLGRCSGVSVPSLSYMCSPSWNVCEDREEAQDSGCDTCSLGAIVNSMHEIKVRMARLPAAHVAT